MRTAAAIAVGTDALLISQPGYGEQALEIGGRPGPINASWRWSSSTPLWGSCERPSRRVRCAIATWDLRARMMGHALRTLTGYSRANRATCVFTRQLRERIGVVYGPEGDAAGPAGGFTPRSD
jgi:recombination protein RecA